AARRGLLAAAAAHAAALCVVEVERGESAATAEALEAAGAFASVARLDDGETSLVVGLTASPDTAGARELALLVYPGTVSRIRETAAAVLPADALPVVLSRGDDELL